MRLLGHWSHRKDPLLVSWSRPDSYWDVVGRHLPLVFATGVILALSAVLPSTLSSVRLCTFMNLTGLPCPFCGCTRSFAAITSGHWGYAFRNSPVSFLLYAGTLAVFLWNGLGLVLGVQLERGRWLHWSKRQLAIAAILVGILLLANWIYRLSAGLK